jgi:hypothetical protein
MKDSRLIIFRKALDELIDSLEARMRLDRWADPGGIPDPLRVSADQLSVRLGAANRLAAGRFLGSIGDVVRVRAIADAMRRLDAAYVTYCQADDRELAAQALDAELFAVRAAV